MQGSRKRQGWTIAGGMHFHSRRSTLVRRGVANDLDCYGCFRRSSNSSVMLQNVEILCLRS
ncbi:hypothetical protein CCYA_CCYA20G4042 [Cyanidiococcus yangmingshanensis]|nr:hypothetical protein CCYA_CCYA20G4042 [Cyanidiococcus yangmingshanensis]